MTAKAQQRHAGRWCTAQSARRRRDLQVGDLRYAPEAVARVRRLVEQERSCCAFLQFELLEAADEVRLLITAPAAAADAVPDLLAELTGRQQ